MEPTDETTEVVVYETAPQSLTDLATEDLVKLAATLDDKITAQTKILSLVTKLAGPKGIDRLGGNLYFNSGGCDRIASGVGISYGGPKKEVNPLPEGYVEYRFTATFTMGNRSITATGGRASNDPFFSARKDADGKPIKLAAEVVKLRDVENAAWTNCKNNGIKSLLGLRNLTEEMLQAHGVVTDGGSSVTYGADTSEEVATKRKECAGWLKDIADGDKDVGIKILQEMTAFTPDSGKPFPGYRDINKVSAPVILKVLHPNLHKRHDEWEKQYEAQADTSPLVPPEEAAKAFGGEKE